jgi:hypothetical protein
MSIDELWALYERISADLAERMTAEKNALELRLKQLNRGSRGRSTERSAVSKGFSKKISVVLRGQILIFSQRTRTELPQIETTKRFHCYVKGTSRGTDDLFADLVDCEFAGSRMGVGDRYPWRVSGRIAPPQTSHRIAARALDADVLAEDPE